MQVKLHDLEDGSFEAMLSPCFLYESSDANLADLFILAKNSEADQCPERCGDNSCLALQTLTHCCY